MLVAYVQGDIFLPSIKSKTWTSSESVECQMASGTSIPPDQRGDVLLCGAQTQLAWAQTWLRGDIKSRIYENATILNVTFHGAGHGAGRYRPPSWTCKRLSEGIDCE